MATPLKLIGTFDFKEFEDSAGNDEFDYLAYQAGLQLGAGDSAEVGALSLLSSGETLVGTFTDTFYNEAVGTHPGTSLTVGNTTSSLYQITGTAAEDGADFRRPVAQNIAGDSDVYEAHGGSTSEDFQLDVIQDILSS